MMKKGARYIGKGPCEDVRVNKKAVPEGWVCWSPQSLVRSLLLRKDFEAEGNGPPPSEEEKEKRKPKKKAEGAE